MSLQRLITCCWISKVSHVARWGTCLISHKPNQSRDQTEESDKPGHFTKVSGTRTPSENLEYINLVNREPVNKALGGHGNKENDRNGFAEHGFISTRSKQSDGEYSVKGPLESKCHSSKNGVTVPPRGNKL